MDIMKETRNLLVEYYDDEEDDYWYNYEPSPEEIKREAIARAKRLFPYEYKATEGIEVDTTGWELEDYVRVAEELEHKYKNIVLDMGYTLKDMRYATSDNTDSETIKLIANWRRWSRFVRAYSEYL